ncbi:MAG: hypothetical protein DU489_07025 [Nitrosomonas sp.]|uniref:hypothetical protein n=1 Tax=Nitrosomonas sp. TaxID=42353 RepID=UPI0032EABA38
MQKSKDSANIGGFLTIKTFKDGKLIRQSGPFKNKVVSSNGYGRNLILRQMAGDTTYPIEIDSVSVGDGAVAPVDGDTALGNSLVSGINITNMTVVNNVLTIDVFVADGNLPDDTYSEFGLFANGRLISRIIISPSYTKSTGEDTLFTYEMTMTG